MIPYGIIIKQNRIVFQQSLTLWQRKFGLLNPSKFLLSAIPLISAFVVIYGLATVFFEKDFSVVDLISGMVMNSGLLAFLMYLTAARNVRDYASTAREENIQLVLTEDALEITTEFSKELVPYSDIALCYEKNFLLTVITDKNAFPLSVSKMHFVNGSYDIFVSLLKSKVQNRYVKKGEN